MSVLETTCLKKPSFNRAVLPQSKEIYMRLLLEGHLEFIGLKVDATCFFSDPAADNFVVVLLETNKEWEDKRVRERIEDVCARGFEPGSTLEWKGWLNKRRLAVILSLRVRSQQALIPGSSLLSKLFNRSLHDSSVRIAFAVGDSAKTIEQIPESYQAARKRMENKLSFEINRLPEEGYSSRSHGTDTEMLRTISSYILKHFRNPAFSLIEISEHFKMKPPHFSTFFKELFREKFIDYLTRLRVEHAKHLLQSTEEPVQLVGRRVGYLHSVSFIRAFKKSVGRTPGDYRRGTRLS